MPSTTTVVASPSANCGANVRQRPVGDGARPVFVAERARDRTVVFSGVDAAVTAGLPDDIAHCDDRDSLLAGDGSEFALAAAGKANGSEYSHTPR